MTHTVSSSYDELRALVSGEVIAPGDPGYDAARTVYNTDIDRRPSVIVRCTSTADVSAAVGWAARHAMAVCVRGGAHSTAGVAVADDALMIDLSGMREVSVDADARRARVGGGALHTDVDAAAQAHGLAVPLGAVGHTGVGGLTLGGGMGWLSRLHGLAADNLVEAEVVLADGTVVRADSDENPDLFWALRGGGGNFGVVTEFRFALHPLHPTVEFSMLFWGLDQGAEVLRLARDVIADLPSDLNMFIAAINAPPEPFVPEQYRFQPGYALLIAGFGADVGATHAAVVSRIRETVPPLFEMTTPMPYVALQQMLDEAYAWGNCVYEKGVFLPELTDPVIDVVTEHIARKQSPTSNAIFYVLDGAYSAVDDDATAFGGGRSPRLNVFLIGFTPDPESLPAERRWVRDFHAALAPLAIGREAYVNASAETDELQVRDTYGRKYERLGRIKAEYDPGNVFHTNANIKPA
jgi:FAD/FMN-containing dehydrogenase